MADLSQLTDDQLGTYRDLLAQKQAPPVPKPPLPAGLKPAPDPFPGATGPVAGGPIIPEAGIIPSAVGYGVSKLGEHVGLPEWANVGAGVVASGLAGGAQSGIGRLASMGADNRALLAERAVQKIPYFGPLVNYARNLGEERPVYSMPGEPAPTITEPFSPNPNIAAKMRFGGPVDTGGGKSFPGVGMSGAPELETSESPVFQPNKVNPNIANRIRFGGSIDPGPSQSYGRVGMSGAPAAPPLPITPAPVPFVPNKVNQAIAKNLRFTPSAEPGSNAAAGPASTLGTRAEMMRQIRLKQNQGGQ